MTAPSASAGHSRAAQEITAIRLAASSLGLTVHDVQPVSLRRTGVYRVVVVTDRPRAGFPAGRSVQAARVNAIRDAIMPPHHAHRLIHDLHHAGAPVPAPRHRDLVATDAGPVGFWEWMTPALVTAHQWGTLTAAFHRAGHKTHPGRCWPYHPAKVFQPRLRLAHALTADRGHPLFGAHRMLSSFGAALEVAVEDALAAAATEPGLLVHGDNQPGNVMRTTAGRLVFNDFERVASGPAALDLAALTLGVAHFGYPQQLAEDFRAGYGTHAPTLHDARPYARIRELSGILVMMIHAADNSDTEHEMRIRAVAIDSPGRGEPWTYLGHPNAMALAEACSHR